MIPGPSEAEAERRKKRLAFRITVELAPEWYDFIAEFEFARDEIQDRLREFADFGLLNRGGYDPIPDAYEITIRPMTQTGDTDNG